MLGWFKWLRSGPSSGVLSSTESREDMRGSLLDNSMLSLSFPASESGSLMSEEQRYVVRRIQDNPMWTLDRGTGFYMQERLNKKKASLLGTGRDAGKSKVQYQGIEWTRMLKHVWKRDFFTTAVHARFRIIVAAMVAVFISSFLFWACIYYVIWRLDEECFLGFNSFLSAFLFSIETQNTIGYGSHAIGDCWLPAWLVGIQCIMAVLLEAIFIGIMFAKISHPKGRSRTILISECACIARRDGILKFMFRVADIRKRTAIAPKIHAVMYTWGAGHTTAEGEHIPVSVQPLPLHYQDATLLLPVVVEHTIDERSPLYGHTSESLEALSAEVVVTFEGNSELGDTFMTRQSYLPSEIHWGCRFVNIIQQAATGSMQHSINLSRFHDVEPLEGLALMPPHRISRAVVLGGARRIPWPRLGENTLLLADELVVTQGAGGRWFVAVRVGDAYPSQMCSASVKMFIYRYNGSPPPPPSAADAACPAAASQRQQTYIHQELPLTRHLWSSLDPQSLRDSSSSSRGSSSSGSSDPAVPGQAANAAAGAAGAGGSRGGLGGAAPAWPRGVGGVDVLLRYPVVVGHEIGPGSPLKDWVTFEGMLRDADAEIVVVTSATQYISSHLAMRSKVYSVLGSIRWGHSYAPCVVPPKRSPTGHALVDWSNFHNVTPVHPAAARSRRGGQQYHQQQQGQQRQQRQQTKGQQQGTPFSQQHLQQQSGQEVYPESASGAAAAFGSMVNEPGRTGLAVWDEEGQQPGSATAAGSAAGWHHQQGALDSHSGGLDGSSSRQGPLPVSQQQQQQQEQEQFVAHSMGFQEIHNAAGMRFQQQQQQLQGQPLQQQQQQVRQAVSSAAQLHQTATAGVSIPRQRQQQQQREEMWDQWDGAGLGNMLAHPTRSGSGGNRADLPASTGSDAESSGSFRAQQAAVHGQLQRTGSSRGASGRLQQQPYEDDEQHTLTLMPPKGSSWTVKRSLATVLDMFEAANAEEAAAESAAAAAATAAAVARGGHGGPAESDESNH